MTAVQPASTNGCVFAAWAQKANNYIRVCAANDKDAQFSSLEDVNPTSQLVFRTNHRLVVLNDVVNGNVLERTFSPTERYPRAHVETKSMEYLYNDGDLYYFMDNETYEQLPLNRELVEDAMQYVKENTSVDVKFFKGQAFSVEAPNFVELAITQTDPGIKGDTATGGTKPATLETGAVVNVPLFVNEGDVIRVDTRSGEYMSRV